MSFVTTVSSSTNGFTRLSPGCVRSKTTRQNCVKLSVWSLQSMVFSMKHNATRVGISSQSPNMLCPVGKIHSPFPFQQRLIDTRYRVGKKSGYTYIDLDMVIGNQIRMEKAEWPSYWLITEKRALRGLTVSGKSRLLFTVGLTAMSGKRVKKENGNLKRDRLVVDFVL